jgi:hypothetical protein
MEDGGDPLIHHPVVEAVQQGELLALGAEVGVTNDRESVVFGALLADADALLGGRLFGDSPSMIL